jgi:glycine/D-amino acid oxidase-like deaminating enzyme
VSTHSPSYWSYEPGPAPARPSLELDEAVDVAIVGAGCTGLWTAWHLTERDPALSIAIVDAQHPGFGASGRNGGWVTSNMGLSVRDLARSYGPDAARAVRDTMRESVDAIGTVGIECDYRKNGLFLVARGPGQVPALRESYAAFEAVGRADGLEWFDRDRAVANVAASRVEAGLFNAHGASIQPAKLSHGLAESLERQGVRIYERSPAQAIEPRSGAKQAVVRTPGGALRANTVVLSAEAWVSQLAPRRRVMPVYSLIVITEPLTDAQWEGVGWERCACLASFQLTVDYLTKTPDGRVMFGGRGAPYHFASRIRPEFDRDESIHERLRRSVVEWWPHLEGIRFAHAWGGPLALPRDFTPNIAYDSTTALAGAYGYVGQGVATTHLAGSYLAAMILDGLDELRPLPFLGHASRRWEPEPLRWAAARYVQRAFERIDERTERTGRAPLGRTIAERLFGH